MTSLNFYAARFLLSFGNHSLQKVRLCDYGTVNICKYIFCCILLLHLAGIDSFGVNYTAPLSGSDPGGLFRMLLRRPVPDRKFRNPDLNTPDRRRQK